MKKIYLSALSAMVGVAAMAQVDVTFQVDMNGVDVSPNGVHVAGNWQDNAGFPGEWQPNTSQMTDDDGDGIYTLSVTLDVTGEYQFKYINGSDWGESGFGVEGVPQVSQLGGGNDNRYFAVGDYHATDGLVLPAVQFGGSAPEGKVAVRVVADLTTQAEVNEFGVHIGGSFSDPVWTPGLTRMSNLSGTDRYATVIIADPSTSYQYKFINGNDWVENGSIPESVPGECSVSENREVAVGEEDIILDPQCFSACGPCTEPTAVTFNVDMSSDGGGNPEGVSIAGAFQGWSPGVTFLTDDDGDGIFTVTLNMDPGTYQYKIVNGTAWGQDESVPGACNVGGNREVVVGAEPLEVNICFGQCSETCVANPEPAEITFQVQFNAGEASSEGVFLIGGFTDPAWQAGAVQMTDDDGDNIYTAVVNVSGPAEIQYKFTNGDPNVVENEENGNFEAGGCGNANAVGGYDRVHIRSGSAETLDIVCFNACVDCASVSVDDIEVAGEVRIFPNPFSDVVNVEFENPNGYRLTYRLLDVTGKQVIGVTNVTSDRVAISKGDLKAGFYFVEVMNQLGQRAVYRVLAQ